MLTDKGRVAFGQALVLEAPRMNRLSSGIKVEDIQAMQRVLATLRSHLADVDAC